MEEFLNANIFFKKKATFKTKWLRPTAEMNLVSTQDIP